MNKRILKIVLLTVGFGGVVSLLNASQHQMNDGFRPYSYPTLPGVGSTSSYQQHRFRPVPDPGSVAMMYAGDFRQVTRVTTPRYQGHFYGPPRTTFRPIRVQMPSYGAPGYFQRRGGLLMSQPVPQTMHRPVRHAVPRYAAPVPPGYFPGRGMRLASQPVPQAIFRPIQRRMPRYAAPVPPRYFPGGAGQTAFRSVPQGTLPEFYPSAGSRMIGQRYRTMPAVFRPLVRSRDPSRFTSYVHRPQIAQLGRSARVSPPRHRGSQYQFRSVARGFQTPSRRFAWRGPMMPIAANVYPGYRFRPVKHAYQAPSPAWRPTLVEVRSPQWSAPGHWVPPGQAGGYRFRPDPRFQVSQSPSWIYSQGAYAPALSRAMISGDSSPREEGLLGRVSLRG